MFFFKRVAALEERVAALEKKEETRTISQTTTKPEEKPSYQQLFDEWFNGAEGENE